MADDREPTLDDLRGIAHADTLPLLERGDPGVRAALEAQWKAANPPLPAIPKSEPPIPKPPQAGTGPKRFGSVDGGARSAPLFPGTPKRKTATDDDKPKPWMRPDPKASSAIGGRTIAASRDGSTFSNPPRRSPSEQVIDDVLELFASSNDAPPSPKAERRDPADRRGLARVPKVLQGGLFALFFALVVLALQSFGVVTVNWGHVYMFSATVVGVLILCLEIIPGRPTKHKVRWAIVLVFVMIALDLLMAWTAQPSAPASPVATLSDPVVYLEPERAQMWSTEPSQKVGVFTLTLHNTGLEDVDHVEISEDFFVAQKDNKTGNIMFKNLGGVPVVNRVPNNTLKSKAHAPVKIDFTDQTEVMREVMANFKSGPSLGGVKVKVVFRRQMDGKEFTLIRAYAVIGQHAEGIYGQGWGSDTRRSPDFLELNEVTPYLDSPAHWMPVTKAISWDEKGNQTIKHY